MSKIAIIYMGGTFGCIGQPLHPMPSDSFLNKLKDLQGINQNDIHFYAAPSIKDSTEFHAADWLQLCQFLQTLSLQFQHFIIIHGTDTLSYAAAFLHHIFKQQYRVILTGSQQPLLTTDGTSLLVQSDAWDNLKYSIDQIHQIPCGVYLAFNQQLHIANQSYKQHTEKFNAFTSAHRAPNAPTLALNLNITPNIIEKSQYIRLVNLYLTPTIANNLNTELQHISNNLPHILILQSFGSGNLPYSIDLENTLKQLIDQGCWLVISSQVLYGEITQKYATGSWLNNVNLVFDPHYSQADLYARSVLLYLQYGDQKNWQQYWI